MSVDPQTPPAAPEYTAEDHDADLAAAAASRAYLDAYAAYAFGVRPAQHHQLWCERIQEVVEDRPLWLDGTTKSRKRKLLLTAPPGHAKSTYVSQVLPPWYLGHHPDHHVLFYTSVGPNAANFDGVVAANLESNPRHQYTFPDERCRPNYKRGWSSEGRFLNGVPFIAKDPSYRAVGWGTSILGSRAHGYVLDDVMTQEEAQSEVEQAKAKNKFEGTVDTRLIPGGWAIGIMTRWHELDLPSYLAKLPDWEHVNYPALSGGNTSHPQYPWGNALWPDRFPEAWLLLKQLANPELFEAYWQGDPTSLGGNVFKAKHFLDLPPGFTDRKGAPSVLDRLVKVQMWDLNYSSKTSADYTVGLTLGVDYLAQRFYVLRVFRAQLEEHQHAAAIEKEILLAKPALVGIWRGAYKTAAVKNLVSQVQRRLVGRAACTVIDLEETTDKRLRAMLPASYGAMGQLFVYKQAAWYPEFLSECLGFPNKAHDDQVDALSGAFQLALEYGALTQMPGSTSYGFGDDPPSNRSDQLLSLPRAA